MRHSWVVWGLVCVLGCACGRTPAVGNAEVVVPTPEAMVSPSPATVASPSPPPSPESLPRAGVAIYLTTGDITPADLVPYPKPGGEATPPALDEIPLQASPILSQDDIVMYDGATHAFTLTPEAMERLAGSLVALAGPPFVVTVDGEPICVGAFWSPLSSQSFGGVVTMVMPDGTPAVVGGVSEGDVYQIALGYPGPDFFRGEDPCGDPRILDALDSVGKLK
ncbi:MAG: hypothetical protein MUQ10_10860 [Anaerolineae bacterium]|nr:hypothetical protein [Anaerolineae bacterium]